MAKNGKIVWRIDPKNLAIVSLLSVSAAIVIATAHLKQQVSRNVAAATPSLQATITSPVNETSTKGLVAINVNAISSTSIKNIEFWFCPQTRNCDSLGYFEYFGFDRTAPYTYNWDTTKVTPGNYKIKAIVTDILGKTAETNISLGVDSPFISIVSPIKNAYIASATTITAKVASVNTMKNVEFWFCPISRGCNVLGNYEYLGFDDTAPYEFPWDVSQALAGSYQLKTVAFDVANHKSESNVLVTSNMVANPSFELDKNQDNIPDGWISSKNKISRSNLSFYNGKYSLKHSSVEDTNYTVDQTVEGITCQSSVRSLWLDIYPSNVYSTIF